MSYRKGFIENEYEENFTQLYKFFKDWKPVKDVFVLRYSTIITGTMTAITASYINSCYRQAVKLRGKGFASAFLPTVAIPCMVNSLMHLTLIVKPVVMKQSQCEVCLEMKSGAIAFGFGCVYPCVLAPVSAFVCADKYYTYPIPHITQQPKETFKLLWTISKPLLPKLGMISLCLFGAGALICHFEIDNIRTVLSKISSMESYLQKSRERKSPSQNE